MYAADTIKQITVRDQPAPALSISVFPLIGDLDVAKIEIVMEVRSKKLVVIAQDPYDLCVMSGLFEDLLYHARLVGGPSPLVHMDLPCIDDIAHQVDPFCIVVIKEVHEHPGLAMPAAQMYVRYADGAIASDLWHREYLLNISNR